jgi:ubiquitin-like modifier-activating enzyme ATG7
LISQGIDLSIPMPGHSFGIDGDKVEFRINELETLIRAHDAIFLLTDSRESRWLPTVLGAYHKKVQIN